MTMWVDDIPLFQYTYSTTFHNEVPGMIKSSGKLRNISAKKKIVCLRYLYRGPTEILWLAFADCTKHI